MRSEEVSEVGKWLEGFLWEWFVTLTFKSDRVSIYWADKRWQRWIKTLRKEIGHRVEFIRVTEWQKRGSPHFHALILKTDEYDRYKAMKLWERQGNGYARIYLCEPGASYYIAKYITKEGFEYKTKDNFEYKTKPNIDIRFSRCIHKFRQENLYKACIGNSKGKSERDAKVVQETPIASAGLHSEQ